MHQARLSQVSEREHLAVLGEAAAVFAHKEASLSHGRYLSLQFLEAKLADCTELTDTRYVAPLQALKQETRHLMALLHEFCTVSARQQCSLRPPSVAAVVSNLLPTETRQYAAHEVRVDQLLPPDLPLVAVDGRKLKQTQLNLCKNAAEAMPQGGVLTISAYVSTNHVYLDVSDTGAGLPKGVDSLSPVTTTKPYGIGLGLTVIQQIAAAHNGALIYHSTPGKGATFQTALPIALCGTED